MSKNKSNSNNQPATQQFVEDKIDELAQATERGFQHMATKEDMARLERKTDRLEIKVDRLERGVKALLDASKETNQMLREQQKIPDRVSRLEHTVFRS